jgi:hypothetical protein
VHGASGTFLAASGAIIFLGDDPGRVFDIVLGHDEKAVESGFKISNKWNYVIDVDEKNETPGRHNRNRKRSSSRTRTKATGGRSKDPNTIPNLIRRLKIHFLVAII